MRVVVKIPSHAYAELVAELERVPPRQRAERLRLLANIGATVVSTGIMPIGKLDQPACMTEQEPERTHSERLRRVRERLKREMN